MPTYPIPADIDPAVLQPGQTVIAVLDEQQTLLTVLRVEFALICGTPDGQEIMLLAHETMPANEDAET